MGGGMSLPPEALLDSLFAGEGAPPEAPMDAGPVPGLPEPPPAIGMPAPMPAPSAAVELTPVLQMLLDYLDRAISKGYEWAKEGGGYGGDSQQRDPSVIMGLGSVPPTAPAKSAGDMMGMSF